MSYQRYDYDVIANWIEPGERVLDLGCGDGSLLRHLSTVRQVRGYGVENDPERNLRALPARPGSTHYQKQSCSRRMHKRCTPI